MKEPPPRRGRQGGNILERSGLVKKRKYVGPVKNNNICNCGANGTRNYTDKDATLKVLLFIKGLLVSLCFLVGFLIGTVFFYIMSQLG